MTEKKLIELAALYLKACMLLLLPDQQVPKRANPTKLFTDMTHVEKTQHLAWMCTHIMRTAAQDPVRMQRWLGFVQGFLAASGQYTVNDLRAHNPEEMSIP